MSCLYPLPFFLHINKEGQRQEERLFTLSKHMNCLSWGVAIKYFHFLSLVELSPLLYGCNERMFRLFTHSKPHLVSPNILIYHRSIGWEAK